MLEKLGVYGMEGVENAILAGLVTGDPLLLVGGHGSGKTMLCERLAQTLGLKFWAYDASKAMFEDVLGFPDPGSLAQGQVDYVPTPISIWGKEFVLIDELSRANPSMQNKWLEVIRSRQVMGKKITGLNYIIAAMNPPSYLGAHPLDEALAGRFAVVVNVPELSEMDQSAVESIIQQISEDDAPMLASERRKFGGLGLAGFLDACRKRMQNINPEYKDKLVQYVIETDRFLNSRGIALDGRRYGMIYRNLRACLAVTDELDGDQRTSLEDYEEQIGETLDFSAPFIAIGQEMSLSAVRGAHQYAKAVFNGGIKCPVLVLPKNPLTAKEVYVKRIHEISRQEARSGLTNLIARAKSASEPEIQAPAIAAVVDLCAELCEGKLGLAPDDEQRLLSYFLKMTLANEEDMDESFQYFKEVLELDAELELETPEALLSFRLALNAVESGGPRTRRRRVRDENAMARLTKELLNLFRLKGGRR